MILIEKANNLPKTFTETIPMYRKTATETLRMECFKYGADNHATLSAKVLNSGVYWALVEFEIPEGMLTGEWVVKFYDYTGMVSETLMRIVFEQQALMEYDIHSDLKEYDRGEHYNLDYLRFEFEEDNATLFAKASAEDHLQFSFDKEHWFDYLEPNGSNIIVNGRVIYFRGLRTDFQSNGLNFRSETRHDIYGDIRTLTNFVLLDNDTAPRLNAIFYFNKGLVNFYAKLPYKKLTYGCYQSMFQNCGTLTTAPALPATELAESCYNSMFQGCTTLTETPELPATILSMNCYYQMFQGCTKLKKVTTYANDISANMPLTYWLANVSSTGEFHNHGTATYPRGTSGIPTGWTEIKE